MSSVIASRSDLPALPITSRLFLFIAIAFFCMADYIVWMEKGNNIFSINRDSIFLKEK
jgi:hypothetical protein